MCRKTKKNKHSIEPQSSNSETDTEPLNPLSPESNSERRWRQFEPKNPQIDEAAGATNYKDASNVERRKSKTVNHVNINTTKASKTRATREPSKPKSISQPKDTFENKYNVSMDSTKVNEDAKNANISHSKWSNSESTEIVFKSLPKTQALNLLRGAKTPSSGSSSGSRLFHNSNSTKITESENLYYTTVQFPNNASYTKNENHKAETQESLNQKQKHSKFPENQGYSPQVGSPPSVNAPTKTKETRGKLNSKDGTQAGKRATWQKQKTVTFSRPNKTDEFASHPKPTTAFAPLALVPPLPPRKKAQQAHAVSLTLPPKSRGTSTSINENDPGDDSNASSYNEFESVEITRPKRFNGSKVNFRVQRIRKNNLDGNAHALNAAENSLINKETPKKDEGIRFNNGQAIAKFPLLADSNTSSLVVAVAGEGAESATGTGRALKKPMSRKKKSHFSKSTNTGKSKPKKYRRRREKSLESQFDDIRASNKLDFSDFSKMLNSTSPSELAKIVAHNLGSTSSININSQAISNYSNVIQQNADPVSGPSRQSRTSNSGHIHRTLRSNKGRHNDNRLSDSLSNFIIAHELLKRLNTQDAKDKRNKVIN